MLRPADYRELHALFERTLLTARLHDAVASAYFGWRVWSRGPAFRTPFVTQTIDRGLHAIDTVAAAIRTYPSPPPAGQWTWASDADQAIGYRERIAKRMEDPSR